MPRDAEWRGVQAWRQYVEDMQAWREEYVRLAAKYREAMGAKPLPGGELTANDTN